MAGVLDEMIPVAQSRDVPTVEQMQRWIAAYYELPGNTCGGCCHIVLDDYNLEDGHLTWTQGYCSGAGDDVGARLLMLLERMSPEDRERAVMR